MFLRIADLIFQWRRRIQRYVRIKLQMRQNQGLHASSQGVPDLAAQQRRGQLQLHALRSIQRKGQACNSPGHTHTHTRRLYPYACDWLYVSAQKNSRGTHVNTDDTSDLILFLSLADQMKICKWEIDTNMYSVSGKQIQICSAWIPSASDTRFSQYMEFWCSHLQAPGQTSPQTPSGGSLQ